MEISIIVAYGQNQEIGLDNKMLWYIPEDFKNFKRLTTNHCVLMGRKTFESIGKPLPNRTSLIVSSSGLPLLTQDNIIGFNSINKAIEYAKQKNETELFIIGGSSIYEQILNNNTYNVDNLYISEINYTGKADSYFPLIDYSKWDLVNTVEYEERTNDTTIPAWKFITYKRKKHD